MTLEAPPRTRRALLAWWVLPSMLVLGPALVERSGVAVEEDSLRRVLAFALLGVTLATPWRDRPGRWAWAIAGLSFLVAATVLWPRASVPGLVATAGTPWSPILLGLAVVVGATRLELPAHRLAAGLGIVVAATLAGAWMIVDRVAGHPGIGPFGRTGIAGPAIAAALPFMAWPLSRPGPRARGLPLVIGLAAIVASGSRTGLVAGILGLSVYGAAAARPRALPGALAVASLVTALYLAFLGGLVPADALIARSETAKVRAGLARASVALVAERPLGRGAHGFSTDVLRVRDLEEARISGGRRPLLAHDDVLQAAVEGGIVGGVALLAVLVLSAGLALVRVRGAREPADRPFLAAVSGSLLALGIASLAENPLFASTTAVLFGLAAGAAAGGRGPHSSPQPARGNAIALRAVASCVALLGAVVGTMAISAPAQRALHLGSFRADERSRADAYRHAADLAKAGDFAEARRAYDRILEVDPGATEVRLDLAETYKLEGRPDDAEALLEEARRADPTRFDVPQRIGHLRLGPESVPSKRVPLADPLPVLRAYNEAAALAPDRFETPVAYARVHRRQGRLADASQALATAKAVAHARGQGLPNELLLESFRLAEAQGARPRDALGILTLGLAAGPGGASDLLREADACLDAAEEKDASEANARKDADAAALRYAGLVLTGRVDPAAVRAAAARAAAADRHRRALSLYRGLLTDPYVAADPDIALAARESAVHVDRVAADELAARARVLLGFEALDKGDAVGAERHFRAALSRDDGEPATHYGLARALARQGRKGEAGVSLRQALDLDPSVAARLVGDPDLEGVTPAPKDPARKDAPVKDGK